VYGQNGCDLATGIGCLACPNVFSSSGYSYPCYLLPTTTCAADYAATYRRDTTCYVGMKTKGNKYTTLPWTGISIWACAKLCHIAWNHGTLETLLPSYTLFNSVQSLDMPRLHHVLCLVLWGQSLQKWTFLYEGSLVWCVCYYSRWEIHLLRSTSWRYGHIQAPYLQIDMNVWQYNFFQSYLSNIDNRHGLSYYHTIYSGWSTVQIFAIGPYEIFCFKINSH